MKKLTVYGLPITPASLLTQLRGSSFCCTFANKRQVEEAIELVGEQGILLVDNGAFSMFQAGVSTMSDQYLDAFETWAEDILDRCPQAVAVVPDVIGGTEEQNRELACTHGLPWDRSMAIWHLDESIEFLLWLCESFGWVGFGSSGKYFKVGTPEWHARMTEAFAAIDRWEAESEGAYIRPRIHLMRAQSMAHLYPVDSSDSTNVAVNHNRWRRRNKITERHVEKMAKIVDDRIQASAGPEAEHQVKRPLLFHVEASKRDREFWFEMALAYAKHPHPADTAAKVEELELPIAA